MSEKEGDKEPLYELKPLLTETARNQLIESIRDSKSCKRVIDKIDNYLKEPREPYPVVENHSDIFASLLKYTCFKSPDLLTDAKRQIIDEFKRIGCKIDELTKYKIAIKTDMNETKIYLLSSTLTASQNVEYWNAANIKDSRIGADFDFFLFILGHKDCIAIIPGEILRDDDPKATQLKKLRRDLEQTSEVGNERVNVKFRFPKTEKPHLLLWYKDKEEKIKFGPDLINNYKPIIDRLGLDSASVQFNNPNLTVDEWLDMQNVIADCVNECDIRRKARKEQSSPLDEEDGRDLNEEDDKPGKDEDSEMDEEAITKELHVDGALRIYYHATRGDIVKDLQILNQQSNHAGLRKLYEGISSFDDFFNDEKKITRIKIPLRTERNEFITLARKQEGGLIYRLSRWKLITQLEKYSTVTLSNWKVILPKNSDDSTINKNMSDKKSITLENVPVDIIFFRESNDDFNIDVRIKSIPSGDLSDKDLLGEEFEDPQEDEIEEPIEDESDDLQADVDDSSEEFSEEPIEENSHVNLILYGPPGTGKTFNLPLVVWCIENGQDLRNVLYNRTAEVLSHIPEENDLKSSTVAFK